MPRQRHHHHHHRATHHPVTQQVRPSSDQNVLRAQLANGLRVIIVRNTLAPVVATSVNYLVGSNESPNGLPGTAHALEHMMFRGSPGLSADQLANLGSVMRRRLQRQYPRGLTQYLYTVPSEDLDVALNIEALRMKAVLSTDADWATERGAIEQEVAQDMSAPGYNSMSGCAPSCSPARLTEHDALGSRPTFEKPLRTMLRDFHRRWQRMPNNAHPRVGRQCRSRQRRWRKSRRCFGPIEGQPCRRVPPFRFKPVKPAIFTIDPDDPDKHAGHRRCGFPA